MRVPCIAPCSAQEHKTSSTCLMLASVSSIPASLTARDRALHRWCIHPDRTMAYRRLSLLLCLVLALSTTASAKVCCAIVLSAERSGLLGSPAAAQRTAQSR
jgi:hypothetical protein